MTADTGTLPPARIAPIEWLCLLLGGWFSLLYGWLLDDAFIYFRYVDNLLAGRGLVYNAAERLESFSSPLFVLLLSLLRSNQSKPEKRRRAPP